ncbi:MAG: IS1595 family transposase [Bacteroidota bacterium]
MEQEFPDDATCLDWLWKQNHSADGQHAMCPKCGVERKFHRVAKRASYSCDVCGHHIHPTAGTIFHKSSTGLHLWFKAIFLMSSTRCGVSAKQIERELGVTYKTAWRIANLIRNKLMDQDDAPLDGEVEVDETMIGGKPRASEKVVRGQGSAWAADHKVATWGAVERGGRVRVKVVPHIGGLVVRGQVRKHVSPTATVFTDEAGAYTTLYREGFQHFTINHSERVYARGNVHTQTIEGFWALVKNGIRGTHHSVSRKWLQSYLDEFAFRYNERKSAEPMFRTLLALACRQAS